MRSDLLIALAGIWSSFASYRLGIRTARKRILSKLQRNARYGVPTTTQDAKITWRGE